MNAVGKPFRSVAGVLPICKGIQALHGVSVT
jgi:hypothetical protein